MSKVLEFNKVEKTPNELEMKGFWFLVVCVAICSHQVNAGTFRVSPMRIEFSPKTKITTLNLTNPTDEPILIEAQVFKWSQTQGQDIYTQTQDIIATPTIFSIAPGQSQLLRLGLLTQVPVDDEQAYRIYLQELPNLFAQTALGLQMQLRVGLPIFVAPTLAISQTYEFKVEPLDETRVKIKFDNKGNNTIHVAHLQLKNESGHALTEGIRLKYILPHQMYETTLTLNTPLPLKYRLTAFMNGKEVIRDLPAVS